MIVSKEYTVLLRLAELAGVILPLDRSDDVIYMIPIVVEKTGENRIYPPHLFPGHSYQQRVIYVGCEWLQNNLTDEEMAQWVALRLLGKLDKSTELYGNAANYNGEATIPLKRNSKGELCVSMFISGRKQT